LTIEMLKATEEGVSCLQINTHYKEKRTLAPVKTYNKNFCML